MWLISVFIHYSVHPSIIHWSTIFIQWRWHWKGGNVVSERYWLFGIIVVWWCLIYCLFHFNPDMFFFLKVIYYCVLMILIFIHSLFNVKKMMTFWLIVLSSIVGDIYSLVFRRNRWSGIRYSAYHSWWSNQYWLPVFKFHLFFDSDKIDIVEPLSDNVLMTLIVKSVTKKLLSIYWRDGNHYCDFIILF